MVFGGSSENPSVAQAESCQVGSTVFPLEFISPTTYGEGRFTCLSGNEWRRTRKLLNLCSFLPSSLLVFLLMGSHFSLYIYMCFVLGAWVRFISAVYTSIQSTDLLQVIKRLILRAGQIALNVERLVLKAAGMKQRTFYHSKSLLQSKEKRKHTHTQIKLNKQSWTNKIKSLCYNVLTFNLKCRRNLTNKALHFVIKEYLNVCSTI